jgi:hypothetical protein
MTTTTTLQTTIEQADALIDSIGMTDLVEDYEFNELGHVYALTDGCALVVTSATTFTVHSPEE